MFAPSIINSRCLSLPPCRITRPTTLIGRRSANVVCLAGDSSKPDLVDDATMTNLSPMAREVFREAQENILALNRSRLKALEELKAAKQMIAELERKLEEATEQVTNLATTVQDIPGTSNAAASISGNGSQYADMSSTSSTTPSITSSDNDTVFFSFDTSSSAPPPQQTPPTHKVTLIYESGWEYAYIHCKIDGSKWTTLPGKPIAIMTEGEYAGKKVVALDCDRLEFVMTDGHGRFDAPNPYGEPDKPTNYVIDGPGVYRLKSGKLTKLS